MRLNLLACLAGVAAISGCSMQTDMDAASSQPGQKSAGATIAQPDGMQVAMATFTETADGLRLTVDARGMVPGSVHGLHVHMVGRCDGPDFTSAGAHWNPTGMMHGKDAPNGPHMGDLANLTIAADGTGQVSAMIAGATISGSQRAMLDADGAAVVIHTSADDYRTDPTGNSGGRIACGVVQPLP